MLRMGVSGALMGYGRGPEESWGDGRGRGRKEKRTFLICLFQTCDATRTLTVLSILPAETTMPAMVRGVGVAIFG